MKDELPFKVTKYKDLKEVGKKPPKKESTRKNKGKKKQKGKKTISSAGQSPMIILVKYMTVSYLRYHIIGNSFPIKNGRTVKIFRSCQVWFHYSNLSKKKNLNDSNIVTVTKPKGRMHLKGKCSMLKMEQEW